MTPLERSYEIHEVARLTGLSAGRLRAWERRYEVVRPSRQANGYRAYSADQVALLRAYARLIEGGERIGYLAARPRDDVLATAEEQERKGSAHGALVDAVRAFDRDRLEALVAQQLALRGLRGFADEVALPLAQAVGDLWALGKIPIAAEHLASEVVVHALKGGLRAGRGSSALCACLPGERHEWGFLCTLTRVQDEGWRIHYLGPDLPLDEVVGVAWKLRPQAVALSVSAPETVSANLKALESLPGRLPPGTAIVIGGGGAEPHAVALRRFGYGLGLEAFPRPEPAQSGGSG